MKVFEEKTINNKTRILFALGFEEIDTIHALVVKCLEGFPDMLYPQEANRMRDIQKTLAVYLGRRKERVGRTPEYSCPKCKAHPRGEKAIQMHLKDVHSKENPTLLPDEKQ